MNSNVYEKALSDYLTRKEKADGMQAEKKTLLQKATNAIKAADSAMKAALSSRDKSAFKKAMKQREEAEGDEAFYKGLLSQSDEIDEADRLEANKTLLLIQGEEKALEQEAEKAVYDKFLELYQIVLDYQLELKLLLCGENAYKIEVLKGDNSQYQAWNVGLQPQNFQKILDTARTYAILDGSIGKKVAAMTNEIEAKRVAERSKWGRIGGRAAEDI